MKVMNQITPRTKVGYPVGLNLLVS